MATTSNAGGGSAMSNAGQGTRGLSAGDWTRIQRLKGARTSGYKYTGANSSLVFSGDLSTNVDIAPNEALQQPYGKALLIPYEAAGTPRTLRPASNWTDYLASQTGDFLTFSQNSNNGVAVGGVVQTQTKICSGVSAVLQAKALNLGANAFNRLKILS